MYTVTGVVQFRVGVTNLHHLFSFGLSFIMLDTDLPLK